MPTSFSYLQTHGQGTAQPVSPNRLQCPICGQASSPYRQQYDIWIRQCCICGHQFTDVTDQPERLHGRYTISAATNSVARRVALALRAQGRYYGRLLARHMPPGRVFDIGSAAGFILAGLQDSGWHVRGLEPDVVMANHACLQVGVPVAAMTLHEVSNLTTGLADSSAPYDLITMVQVVAQLKDPHQVLQMAADATKPGGFWLIETPDRDCFIARLCGQHWPEYCPPDVLHWFSSRDLQQLVGQFGLRLVAQGRPSHWISSVGMRLRWLSQSHPQLQTQSVQPAEPCKLGIWQRIFDYLALFDPTAGSIWMLLQKD
jgi:2-polyprenyl-3-methyl-5-hydroxy-6-metoxy-1,4-benzoquinol methylase